MERSLLQTQPQARRRRPRATPCRRPPPHVAPVVRRALHIAQFTRAAHSGVWYYQVDISVYHDRPARVSRSSSDGGDSRDGSRSHVSTGSGSFGSEDSGSADADVGLGGDVSAYDDPSGDESDASSYASPRCSTEQRAVQSYSVLRRYSDFLDLYAHVKQYLADAAAAEAAAPATTSATALAPSPALGPAGATTLPPFPSKELISPSVFGSLWRLSSSRHVLEERRAKFEALLQFVERHDVARRCPAFERFLGHPPQRQDGGYVSLKEYTSQHWLASLAQLARAKKEQRQRHYTMDAENLAQLVDGASVDAAAQAAFLGKRRRRARPGSNSSVGSNNSIGSNSNSGSSGSAGRVGVSSAVAAAPRDEPMSASTLPPVAHARGRAASVRRDGVHAAGARPVLKKCKSMHHYPSLPAAAST